MQLRGEGLIKLVDKNKFISKKDGREITSFRTYIQSGEEVNIISCSRSFLEFKDQPVVFTFRLSNFGNTTRIVLENVEPLVRVEPV